MKVIWLEFYHTTGGEFPMFTLCTLIKSSQILKWCVLQSAKQLDNCLPYKNSDRLLFVEEHSTTNVIVW